jgi:hypothetical protein
LSPSITVATAPAMPRDRSSTYNPDSSDSMNPVSSLFYWDELWWIWRHFVNRGRLALFVSVWHPAIGTDTAQ